MRLINTLSLMWMLVKYSDGTWKSGNTRADKSYEGYTSFKNQLKPDNKTGFVLLNSIDSIKNLSHPLSYRCLEADKVLRPKERRTWGTSFCQRGKEVFTSTQYKTKIITL